MVYDPYTLPTTFTPREYSDAYFEAALTMASISNQLTTFGAHAAILSGKGHLEVKSQICGMWNAILNICFPTSQLQYTINPDDECQQMGQKTDLFVSYMDGNYTPWPRLGFAGKAGYPSPPSWDNIQRQMLNFMAQKIGTGAGLACWVIAARGEEVKFWRYTTRFSGSQRMVCVYVANGSVVVDSNDNVGATVPPFRIGAEGQQTDWLAIQTILEYMAMSPPIS